MRVAVRKLERVDSVAVSLNEGLATIWFAPDNRITLDQLRPAIRSNGFTPNDAEVMVRGRVRTAGAGLELLVPGSPEARFRLTEPPGRQGVLEPLRGVSPDRLVLIEGSVPERSGPVEGEETLLVHRVSGPEG